MLTIYVQTWSGNRYVARISEIDWENLTKDKKMCDNMIMSSDLGKDNFNKVISNSELHKYNDPSPNPDFYILENPES